MSVFSALGTISPEKWPILRELPTHIKAKAKLVAVATYAVDGKKLPHAFIHCADSTTLYVGSSPKFGESKYIYSMVNSFVLHYLFVRKIYQNILDISIRDLAGSCVAKPPEISFENYCRTTSTKHQ